MSDNTELAAAARNAAAWSVTDDDAAEWITQLADALVAGGRENANLFAQLVTLKVDLAEARRIAEQWRDEAVGTSDLPTPEPPNPLPWEAPSEGGK